jgi:uncharacterized phage protein gp47/JayE
VSQQPTAFQTAYRLTIMVGTLTVGSMAAYRYGPEPERLAETIDYVASMVNEVTGEATAEPDSLASLESAPLAEPAAFGAAPDLWSEPAAPNNGAPRYDAAVQQASALVPIEEEQPPRAVGDFERLERERLTAPLLAAGATQADVAAWGRGADSVYRATASAPVRGNATGDAAGLERRFDAIGATPEEAVQTLAAEVRSATMR